MKDKYKFLYDLNINKKYHDYFKKLKEYIDLKNISNYTNEFKNIINNPNEEYRYFCYRYIDNVKKTYKNIEINEKYETVFIEFNLYPHIEFIIRNTINKLQNWNHTIICGNKNYNFVKNLCERINYNIKIIKMDVDILNKFEYNKMLSSLNFWNLLKGEKILFYDEQTCILKDNINDFIDYDYIGAPWKNKENNYYVGNGSFSLRTKQIMIDIINKIDIFDTKYNMNYIHDNIENVKSYCPPEDVYFTTNMIEYKIGKLSKNKIAKTFSVEAIYSKNPYGIHECFIATNEWKKYFYRTILIDENTEILTFNKELWNCSIDTYKKQSKIHFEYHNNNFITLSNDVNDISKYFTENNFGFIVTRHVGCDKTNKYWKICYESIRKYYNNLIVIIDDHSNYNYISNKVLDNTIIINSNNIFNSGEFLTYYYYIKYKFFNKAIILHDSMFINNYINFDNYENCYLWYFKKLHENFEEEQNYIKLLKNNDKLLDFHKDIEWLGCFGCCSVITWNYLQYIETKYNLSILINHIKTRLNRCYFERVIACILYFENNDINNVCGDIHEYPDSFFYTYDKYVIDFNNNNINKNLNIIKIWSGR